jgi:hypothetical protein
MSMNATDAVPSDPATFRATVDFPDPDPPAMPIVSALRGLSAAGAEWCELAVA